MNVLKCMRSLAIRRPSFPLSCYSTQVEESQSFVMNIFNGKTNASQVLPFPEVLNKDQIDLLHQMVGPTNKFFTEKNDAHANDLQESVSEPSIQCLRDLGAFGLQVPEELEGAGLCNTQYARMVELVGGFDLGMGIMLGAHQSIGFKGILLYGTPEQKAKYLPDLASGRRLAAFCLTEPSAGSDAASVQTRAVKSADGKHYVLNGGKVWISNAGVADVFTVFARTKVRDSKGVEKDKVSAFIVERGFGGVSHSPPEKKLGIKASNTASVFFEDTKVPVANLLGQEGEGFKVAMNILNSGRFGMSAALSGSMRTIIGTAAEHAAQRSQFGQKINSFGAIQEKLANLTVKHYQTESMAYILSSNMDRGAKDYQVEAAISKVYASECAWFCADEAIQILGGMGVMKECVLERFLRDIRVFRIFEGTNDILRLMVALTGIQYAGKHLAESTKSPLGMVGLFGDRAKRALGMSPSGDSQVLTSLLPNQLHDSAKLTADSINQFGASVQNLIIKYKKGIIDQQFLLKRVADSAISIFAMTCALSRAGRSVQQKHPTADLEVRLTKLACNQGSAAVNWHLQSLTSAMEEENFNLMRSISHDVCQSGGVVQPNPLGV